MANWDYYDSFSISFIKVLYRVLLAFCILVVVMLFTLKINDTVFFKEGEVYSTNPQIKITSPSEVKVREIKVLEGQAVKNGDTLFVLENPKLLSDLKVNQADIEVVGRKMLITKQLAKNAQEKKGYLTKMGEIQSRIYQTDRTKAEQELKSLQSKIAINDQESRLSIEKYKSDSLLYTQGAISKIEAVQTKERNLMAEKQRIEGNMGIRQRIYDYNNLKNNYEKSRNDLFSEINTLESQIQNLLKDKYELTSTLTNKQTENKYLFDEFTKLIVLAPIDGTISNLYSTKQNVFQLNKGELLAIVAPKKESFFVKVTLPERDLIYVKQDQSVNLKLDAFYYYKFGTIKGNISYLSPSDINKTFSALVQLQGYNPQITLKAGYKVKGDIIIDEMVLVEYIFKKLLNKIDNTLH